MDKKELREMFECINLTKKQKAKISNPPSSFFIIEKFDNYEDYDEMINESDNDNFSNSGIMLKVVNFKNNKTFVKEIEVPQKFFSIYYTFRYILTQESFKVLFNKKEKRFFNHLQDPSKEIEESMFNDANLQVNILFGNYNMNIGFEIVGDEINFINNEEYISLNTIQDIENLWKRNIANIISAQNAET